MLTKFKVAPIVLVILGAIFLLNNFGFFPWDIWTNLWKFWPVLLILIGIEYLIGQSVSLKTILIILLIIFIIPIIIAVNPVTNNPLSTDSLTVSENLDKLTKAKLIIDMPATNLELTAASKNEKLLEGTVSFSKAANKPEISRETSFGQAIITINQKNSAGLPFLSSLKNDAKLQLNTQIPFELQIKTGTSREKINLNDLRIDYLEINSQASDIDLAFGKFYSSRVTIKSNASSVNIKIPQEMEARIKVNSKVKNANVDSRFKESGGEYKTQNFDKAFTRLDIQIESVAGTITVK